MPYSNVPKEKWGAMESCVEKVMAAHSGEEGFTKENAIGICYDRIVGSTVTVESADIHLEIVTDPSDVNMVLGQNFEPGELLRWKNAELARAEVNANMDELSNENIDALAGTLPLMPLTISHDNEIVGLFTAAYASPAPDMPESNRLLTDGIMYARRFPEIAEEIISGKRRLSVEAFADKAVCSLCGGEYLTARDYCDHLRDRHTSGASRRFSGMRAVGGGVVRNPAGSSTAFDSRQVYMVAEHLEGARGEGKGTGGGPQGDGGADVCVCPKCGAKSSHKKGVSCSGQSCPECGAKMAGQNKSTADKRQLADKSEGGSMDLEQVKSQLDEALSKLESTQEERDEIAEERDGLAAKVVELEASVTALTAELEQVKEEREQTQAELMWKERSSVLASVLDPEELERQKSVIMAMSEEAVSLMVMAAKEKPEPSSPTTLTANLGDADDDSVVVTLV